MKLTDDQHRELSSELVTALSLAELAERTTYRDGNVYRSIMGRLESRLYTVLALVERSRAPVELTEDCAPVMGGV